MVILFCIWLVCLVINIVYIYFSLRQEKYINIEDVFYIILFGIALSPIFTIATICDEFDKIQYKSFNNPLYKESKNE